jgi:rhodanese-related sulfurtransferase
VPNRHQLTSSRSNSTPGTVMIIDVRPPANFEKETIPGAINVPLDQLEGYLKKISKDAYIVFT